MARSSCRRHHRHKGKPRARARRIVGRSPGVRWAQGVMGGVQKHHSGALKTQGLSQGERGADNCLVRGAACATAELAAAGNSRWRAAEADGVQQRAVARDCGGSYSESVALDIGGGVSAAPEWQARRVKGPQQIAAGGLSTQQACSKNRLPTKTTFKTTTSKIQQS